MSSHRCLGNKELKLNGDQRRWCIVLGSLNNGGVLASLMSDGHNHARERQNVLLTEHLGII